MATSSEPIFAFFLGTGRCGSSLIHEVVARHPDIGFVSNVDDRLWPLHLRGRWNNEVYRRVPSAFTRKGRIRFAPSEGYRVLEHEVSPIVCAPARDLVARDASPWLAERIQDFFVERARVQRKPVFTHKFTGWPRARLLNAVFPNARFVHVVRDGRAVAASMVQMPWWRGFEGPDGWGWGPLPSSYRNEWEMSGRSYAVLAGVQWKMLTDAFEDAREEIPAARWLQVRYEDFLDDPWTTVERIFGFLYGNMPPILGRTLDALRVDASRKDAYRRSLSVTDLSALDTVLGVHLQRYGYAPGGETDTPKVAM